MLDKVVRALELAGEPMTPSALRDAIEFDGPQVNFHNNLQGGLDAGVVLYDKKRYSRGKTPVIVYDRRTPTHTRLVRLPIEAPMVGNLRTLMDDGGAVSTGDPLRALADAMDAARAVLAAGRTSKRFAGAEVELLVARELRSITIAAQLAVTTLNEALEVLK
jgi:hypothetical protein